MLTFRTFLVLFCSDLPDLFTFIFNLFNPSPPNIFPGLASNFGKKSMKFSALAITDWKQRKDAKGIVKENKMSVSTSMEFSPKLRVNKLKVKSGNVSQINTCR